MKSKFYPRYKKVKNHKKKRIKIKLRAIFLYTFSPGFKILNPLWIIKLREKNNDE